MNVHGVLVSQREIERIILRLKETSPGSVESLSCRSCQFCYGVSGMEGCKSWLNEIESCIVKKHWWMDVMYITFPTCHYSDTTFNPIKYCNQRLSKLSRNHHFWQLITAEPDLPLQILLTILSLEFLGGGGPRDTHFCSYHHLLSNLSITHHPPQWLQSNPLAAEVSINLDWGATGSATSMAASSSCIEKFIFGPFKLVCVQEALDSPHSKLRWVVHTEIETNSHNDMFMISRCWTIVYIGDHLWYVIISKIISTKNPSDQPPFAPCHHQCLHQEQLSTSHPPIDPSPSSMAAIRPRSWFAHLEWLGWNPDLAKHPASTNILCCFSIMISDI